MEVRFKRQNESKQIKKELFVSVTEINSYLDSETNWDISCGLEVVVPGNGLRDASPDLRIDASIR